MVTVLGILPGTMYRLLVANFDWNFLIFYSLPGKTFQIALMVLDTLRMFDDLYSSPISFMLTAVFVLRMQHNMCYVFHSCGTSHCIVWFSF